MISLLLLSVLVSDPYLPPGGSLTDWDQAAYVIGKLADAYLGAAEANGGVCAGEIRAMPFCSIPRLATGCSGYHSVYLCLRQFLWVLGKTGLVSCDATIQVSPFSATGTKVLDCGGLQAQFGGFNANN